MSHKLQDLRELHQELGLLEEMDREDIAVYNFLSIFIPMQKDWDTGVYHEFVELNKYNTNLLKYYI